MQVAQKSIPFHVRRVAARHLESLRGTDLIRGAEDAFIGDDVVPLYRPDINDVAYYEFTLIGSSRNQVQLLRTPEFAVKLSTESESHTLSKEAAKDRAEPKDRAAGPIGFIIVSNGRHDFPVAHWSLNRLPPSIQVESDPRSEEPAKKRQTSPAKLYKLDALAYAVEDAGGQLIGQTGPLPGIISGLPHSLEKFAGQISSTVAKPLRAGANDSSAESARHDVQRSKLEPPQIKITDEGGWKALKSRYADVFGPLLDGLSRRTARAWEVEDLVTKFGEGILTGTNHRVALLGEASLEISGEGAKFVEATIEKNIAGPPSLIIKVPAVSLPREFDLEALITYRDGGHERLPFFVVSQDVPSNVKAERSRNSTDSEG